MSDKFSIKVLCIEKILDSINWKFAIKNTLQRSWDLPILFFIKNKENIFIYIIGSLKLEKTETIKKAVAFVNSFPVRVYQANVEVITKKGVSQKHAISNNHKYLFNFIKPSSVSRASSSF